MKHLIKYVEPSINSPKFEEVKDLNPLSRIMNQTTVGY